MKGIKIEIPWWLPPLYDEAREQGFEGSLSDFIDLIVRIVLKHASS